MESGTHFYVAQVGEIPPGTSRQVTVEGKPIALFNVEGAFYAIGDRCPHRSGPLHRGRVEGTTVRCPIHGWQFELSSGRCLTRESACTPVYPVLCREGKIFLGLPQGTAAGPSASSTVH